MSERVLGVDACKGGWVGLTNDGRAYAGATIGLLVDAASRDGWPAVVAIDIPIGLPTTSARQADILARAAIGARRSSVFATPIRPALHAATHAEATALSVSATGKGLSQQGYSLRVKILEVDAWARTASMSVIEVHPEVSFATIAGRTLSHAKSTWSGFAERRAILSAAGFEIPDDLGAAGDQAGVDDVLDAAAAAWTAQRFANGEARSLPAEPEDFGDGHLSAIWA